MIAVISCHATEPEDTHQVRIEVNKKADIDKVIETCCLAIDAFTDANEVSDEIVASWIAHLNRIVPHEMGYSCNAFNLRWEPS